MATGNKSIFKLGDKFGIESPLGDWMAEARVRREERNARRKKRSPEGDFGDTSGVQRRQISPSRNAKPKGNGGIYIFTQNPNDPIKNLRELKSKRSGKAVYIPKFEMIYKAFWVASRIPKYGKIFLDYEQNKARYGTKLFFLLTDDIASGRTLVDAHRYNKSNDSAVYWLDEKKLLKMYDTVRPKVILTDKEPMLRDLGNFNGKPVLGMGNYCLIVIHKSHSPTTFYHMVYEILHEVNAHVEYRAGNGDGKRKERGLGNPNHKANYGAWLEASTTHRSYDKLNVNEEDLRKQIKFYFESATVDGKNIDFETGY